MGSESTEDRQALIVGIALPPLAFMMGIPEFAYDRIWLGNRHANIP